MRLPPALGLDHKKIFCRVTKIAGTRSSLPQVIFFQPNGWNRQDSQSAISYNVKRCFHAHCRGQVQQQAIWQTAQWRSKCALNHKSPGRITKIWALSGRISTIAGHLMPGYPGDLVTLQTSVYKGSREGKFQYTTVVRFKYQNPCKSAVQTVRPQVCSSNSETPGLQFKYWDPRSEVQISRSQVYSSWNVDLGSQYLSRRPWFSVFELQTWGLTVWTADLGSHCLNCRPGVSLFELQTWGLSIWSQTWGLSIWSADLTYRSR